MIEKMLDSLNQYGSFIHIRRDQVLTGTITGRNSYGFFVDVGFKAEGFLPMKEYTNNFLVEKFPEPEIGDRVEVEIIGIRDGEYAQLLLSRWRYEFDKSWEEAEQKLRESSFVTVRGLNTVKGGLTVEFCGLEGFIPFSHFALSTSRVRLLNFIGYDFKAMLIEKDKRKHRLIFSRREFLERAEHEKRIMNLILGHEIRGLLFEFLK